MKWLKYLFSAIVSLIVSACVFDTSPWAIIISYCFISMLFELKGETAPAWKKETKCRVCMGISVLGALTIVLGTKCLKNDFIIIIGAMMFATTFSAIIVKDLMVYLSRRN